MKKTGTAIALLPSIMGFALRAGTGGKLKTIKGQAL